jgi:hypothetical protein
MPTYAIQFDSQGIGCKPHSYGDDNAKLDAGEYAVTEAQMQNASQWSLVNGAIVEYLPNLRTKQIATLTAGYLEANAAVISFTDAAGVVDTYQADPGSITDLNNCLSGFRSAAAVPSGFYWRSATNANNAFTYADLVNLSAALATRGFANFAQLQTLKAQVMAATSASAVQAIVWVNP